MLPLGLVLASFMLQPPVMGPPAPDLSSVVEAYRVALTNDNPKDDYPAKDALRDFLQSHPPTTDQRKALYALAATLPTDKDTFRDPQWDIVCNLRDNIPPEDVALIREVFPRLGLAAKGAALVNLSILKSREAATAFVEGALQLTKEPELPYFSFGALHHTPHHWNVLLPALYPLADHDPTAFEFFSVVLEWFQGDRVPLNQVDGLINVAIRTHGRLLKRQRELEKLPPDSEGHSPALADPSHGIEGVILDLLGASTNPKSIAALREAMTLESPELRLWAAASLLQLDQVVPDSELASIAAKIEYRHQLLKVLDHKGVVDHYPRAYRTNRHIAQAHFWDWLRYPTELGEPPAKLELGKVVTMDNERGESVQYFVFKFLPRAKPDQPEPQWQMGIAGPYLTKGGFDPSGGGDTFSNFHPWNENAIEEEIAQVRKHIAESRKLWEKSKTKP